jgi:hypothetical protein
VSSVVAGGVSVAFFAEVFDAEAFVEGLPGLGRLSASGMSLLLTIQSRPIFVAGIVPCRISNLVCCLVRFMRLATSSTLNISPDVFLVFFIA